MATVSLVDILKAWPQETKVKAPKKIPEIFVPSKISEAPKKSNLISNILKEWVWTTLIKKTWEVVKDVWLPILETKQPKLTDILTKQVDYTKEQVKQPEKLLWLTEIWWKTWDTFKWISNVLFAQDQKELNKNIDEQTKLKPFWWASNFIWDSLKIWLKVPFISKVVWQMATRAEQTNYSKANMFSDLTDNIMTWFSTLFPLASSITWWVLWVSWVDKKISEAQDYLWWLFYNKIWKKLWYSEQDSKDLYNWLFNIITLPLSLYAWSKFWWKPTNSKTKIWKTASYIWKETAIWAITSIPDLLQVTVSNYLQWKENKASDLLSVIWTWVIPTWLSESKWKKTSINDIVPSNEKINLSEAQIDKSIAEKQSPTKSQWKISKEDIKLYEQYWKEWKPWQTFEQFKQEKTIPLVETIKKQSEVKTTVEPTKVVEPTTLTEVIKNSVEQKLKANKSKQVELQPVIETKPLTESEIKLKKKFTPTEIKKETINKKQLVSEMLKQQKKQTPLTQQEIEAKIKQPKIKEEEIIPMKDKKTRQWIRDLLLWKDKIEEQWDIFATPEEKATKNLQNIISADINKSPDLKFELWIIQKWLQKVPLVREILKWWSKWFVDIRNKLNNVIVVTKQWLQWLWDVITWIWNRKKQIVEQSVKDFWIEELSNWSIKNSQELIQVRKVLENRLKDIYTNFWPVKWKDWKFTSEKIFDEVWYNNAKSLLKEQYFESIFKNSNLDNLRFISEIYFRDKNFNKWSKLLLDLLPDNIKTKLKELDEKVSVKYDEEWNILNPWSLEHEMTTILWKYLEDIWLLRYKKDWYKRWVITKEMYDYLRKNQKNLWLEKIPDFQEFIKKWYDTTLQQTWDLPKWMSSILKKSKNMEKYHIQDPITRMISYADEVWQLIANRETVDLINNARQWWEKLKDWSTDINQYIWKEADSFARTALWLHDIWITWKIAWKISWWLWAIAIIWSLPILVMSWVSTFARATPTFIRNILGLRFKNDINKTIDFLEKSWIEQKFINETWFDKVVWASYSLFGWGYLDKKVKWLLWNMIIREQLRKIWTKIWKWDDVLDIYSQTLNKLPIEQANKLISDLWRQLNDLSDFSNLSRWQISWLDSRIFNTFKNFWRTTTSRYLSYPTQVINEVYSTFKNNLSKKDLADRSYQKIAFLLADTLWVYLWAKLIVNKLMPWEDEDKKEILLYRLVWWSIKDKIAMLLSYPLQQPWISMISSTFNNIVKLAYDLYFNWVNKNQIDYAKISWLVRQLSILMKEKELTSWGTYKYNNEWWDNIIQNTLLFLLGKSWWQLDYETAKKRIENIQEWDKWLFSWVVDKIIKDQNFFYSWLWETFDILKYWLWDRDTQNDFYNFKVRTESKKNIDTLLSNIKAWEKTPMDVEEYIANAWNWFDIKFDNKDIRTFLKNNLSSNTSEQKTILKTIDELWIKNDPLYKWDMNQYMEQLKTKNPALFYQIIKKIINPVVIKIDKDNKEIKELQYTWQETWASFVDEILVDRFENLPRLASDIANRFEKIITENPTDEQLQSYNDLIKTSQELPYIWDDISDSVSTILWKNLKNIEWIKDKLENYLELQNMLKQAAVLRGIKFRESNNTLQSNKWDLWQQISGEMKNQWIQLPSWVAWKKSKLVNLIQLPQQQVKNEPLFKIDNQSWNRTLVDILLKS